jgi:putative FmdB family regulatory protein
MPTYDYECSACGNRFEELQTFNDPPLTKCPNCKKNKLTRLFGGGGAIIFKGGGFYETDYRRAGETKPAEGAEAPAGEAKTETKPEAKAETPPPPPPPQAPSNKSDGKSKGGGKKAK